MRKNFGLLILATIVFFTACKKNDEIVLPSISDYSPLKVGKYITYKLDSTIYINFGQKDTTISYQVKHEVDAAIIDALGRPAFRIIRYIRKTAANPWVPDNTFMAVNTGSAIEFVENNLRYIKMKAPMRDGFSWKGNSYIDTKSINSPLQYLDEWDYTYDSLNLPSKIGTLTVDSCVKVAQQDETIGNPNDNNSYSERNIGIEKYAKGLGLVYRRFFHNEHQPPANGSPGYTNGYGVILTMIDHN